MWKKVAEGKVRTIYEDDESDIIALVAGDGVSAFDQKLGVEVPGKGQVLTEMSARWMKYVERRGYPTAFITADHRDMHDRLFQQSEFLGRTTFMHKLRMLPIEAIVRGYITGSAWRAYSEGEREICGLELPEDLKNCSELPHPFFTPTTKAPAGEHDQNLTFDEMVKAITAADLGVDAESTAIAIKNMSIGLYMTGQEYAKAHGVILADTKFEFGLNSLGNVVLADELFTPDSSRFWSLEHYAPGREQASMDKQLIRDWVKAHPGQRVPKSILDETSNQYVTVLETLFGV